MDVGLVGRGPRFEALAHLLSNHDVMYWSGDGTDGDVDLPEHVRRVEVAELGRAPLIFLCLPIHRLRPAGRALGSVLSGRHVLVHTTRNLELGTLNAPSTILGEETPTQRFGFLTGPFDTEDVLAGRPGSGVCASEFPEVHDLTHDALDETTFRMYRTEDLQGAEVAAAYTRIIALVAGISRQLELGHSLDATLFSRGLAETARFVIYRGGYEKTTFGMAGCGNLHLDISPQGNIDVEIGAEFMRREGVNPEQLRAEFGGPADGLFNLIESLVPVCEGSGVELPILQHAIRLIEGDLTAHQVVEALLGLPVFHE